jgi:carboxyl-terminal processing protease
LPEILAAALKENAGAKLVGEKTYGDLSAITIIDLVDGSAVAMTTGAFLTGKGGNYNGKGIPVDVEVASAKDDPQLKTALRLAAKGGRG